MKKQVDASSYNISQGTTGELDRRCREMHHSMGHHIYAYSESAP